MLKNGRLYPGNTMQVSVTIIADDGEGMDPDVVVFKTFDPCGNISSYTYGTDDEITRTDAGVYVAAITPDKAGRWNFRWETTTPVFTTEDSFIVLTSPFVTDCYRDYV